MKDLPAIQDETLQSTRESRIAIGFSSRDSWKDASATFTEHSLTIQGHPVMEDWEKSYMYELAGIASRRGGIVLEVGFGMGISASHIQTFPIDGHLIIEANHEVYARAVEFARAAVRPVLPLQGFWEEVTSMIPSESVSGILFDTYPLNESEIHQNHFPFFKEAYRLLSPGGVLTYYSDEVRDYSPMHYQLLVEAGFTDIRKKVCKLDTPPDCAYWKSETMVAPIVRK